MGLQELFATQTTLGKHAARTQLEGNVVPGSWNPATATCQVEIGDTAAFFADSGSQAQVVQCTVKTDAFGKQYAPVGGERALVFWAQGGWTCEFEHSDDDTTGTPSGEYWHLHADPTTIKPGSGTPPTYNTGLKFTNDGPTPGDNLGGAHLGHDGALSELRTKSGYTVTVDDTNQRAYVQVGSLEVIVDGKNGKVFIGADNLAAGKAAITEDDLTAALTAFATDIKTWANANYQAGAGVAVSGPTVPTITGSSKVFIED